MKNFDVVTGAFSYTGRAIAAELAARGRTVHTLTRRAAEPGSDVVVHPFNFDRPELLRATLEGADTVYNTYWVRFERGEIQFEEAVANTITLIHAARDAGVRRFVHVSIIRPTLDSALPYFRGKALMEQALMESGMSYAIIRPTVIFGRGDVFINNIAWLLRHFPLFAVAGDGAYRIQPVHVDDLARICVEAGLLDSDLVRDAAGPEAFTFREFVREIGVGIGRPRPVIGVPGPVFLAMSRMIGLLVRDVVVNRQELDGLMAGLVASHDEPEGKIRLTEWISRHAGDLGRTWSSEIGRNFERPDNKVLIGTGHAADR